MRSRAPRWCALATACALAAGCSTTSSIARLREGPSGETLSVVVAPEGRSLRWRAHRSRLGLEPFTTAARGEADLPSVAASCARPRILTAPFGKVEEIEPGRRSALGLGGPHLAYDLPEVDPCDLVLAWAPRPGVPDGGLLLAFSDGSWHRVAEVPAERSLGEPLLWINPLIAPVADVVVTPVVIVAVLDLFFSLKP